MRFVLLFVLFLTGCATGRPFPVPPYEAPPPTPTADLNTVEWLGPKPTLNDLDTYVSNFRRLAFLTEWSGPSPYVKKWTGARICTPEKYRADTERTLAKLRVATGVPFRVALVPCAVHFIEDPSVLGCRVRFRDHPEKFYDAARVVIGSGFDDVGECIEEEFSQLTGLVNDISYHWTMWNDRTSAHAYRLTWHDAVMLRVLYHSELYQGMPEAEAMKVVPGLMRKVILEIQ